MKKSLIKNKSGLTLIEILIYIAMIGIFLTGAIYLSIDIMKSDSSLKYQRQVMENSQSIISRIGYEIREADSIISVAPTVLVLQTNIGNVTIEKNSDDITITKNSLPEIINSDDVKVSQFFFTDLTKDNSKNISFEITLVSGGFTRSYETAFEIRK